MQSKYLLPAGLLILSVGGHALAASTDTPPSTVTPAAHVVDMIVAKVNGEIITQSELELQRDRIKAELSKDAALVAAGLDEAVKQKQSDALRDKIDQLLLVQKGKELDVNVEPEVTRQIAQLQAESKLVDVEAFHHWVQEQSGVAFEDFRSEMKNHYLTQRVISQEVAYKIQIPQAQLKAYYEAHKTDFVRQEQIFFREILIAPKNNSPADIAAAEKKAKDVCARARKGEKFDDLARSYSDAASAADGGFLTYKRGDLRKDIEDIVFKANRGFVTDPIRTNYGFDILKVEERYEPGQAAFEDVKNEIMEKLFEPRMQPEVRKFMTKLREDAFIEIRGGWVDSGAAPGKSTAWMDPATLKPETTTKAEVLAHKKRRLLGVIPRGSNNVSSSDPGAAKGVKTTQPVSSPAPAPAAPAGSASSSSSNQ